MKYSGVCLTVHQEPRGCINSLSTEVPIAGCRVQWVVPDMDGVLRVDRLWSQELFFPGREISPRESVQSILRTCMPMDESMALSIIWRHARALKIVLCCQRHMHTTV